MTPESARQLVESLGLEYHGAKSYPDRRRGGDEVLLHFISDPTTRATFNLADDQLTAANVQEAAAASRSLFSAARA